MAISSDLSRRPRATMHIGQLSRRSGRSVHTIRWYECIGLVPGVRRDAARRRVYEERHVGWLEFIDRLRLTGMSMKQIRVYADLVTGGKATLHTRRDLLLTHRELATAMISEWQLALSVIDRKIDFYGDWIRAGRRPPEPANSRGPGKIRMRDCVKVR